MLVFEDGTKLFLPEAEAELAALLPGLELALYQKDGKVWLAVAGDADEKDVKRKIVPWQDRQDRSHKIAGITLREDPLPRTATGKVRRWEL